jgi:hypothetical protein
MFIGNYASFIFGFTYFLLHVVYKSLKTSAIYVFYAFGFKGGSREHYDVSFPSLNPTEKMEVFLEQE